MNIAILYYHRCISDCINILACEIDKTEENGEKRGKVATYIGCGGGEERRVRDSSRGRSVEAPRRKGRILSRPRCNSTATISRATACNRFLHSRGGYVGPIIRRYRILGGITHLSDTLPTLTEDNRPRV